jgi:DNA helicase II / ATP-dependent DNA helicase PcrA
MSNPNCPLCQSPMVLRQGKSRFFGCIKFPKCRGTLPYKVQSTVKTEKPITRYTPSVYQNAVYTWIKNTNNDPSNKTLVIEATAGSGKTSTILEALQYIPVQSKTVFLAFNKKIVQELSDRLPTNITASTLHSIGFQALKKHNQKIVLERDKTQALLANMIGENGKIDKEFYPLLSPIKRIISLAKNTLMPVQTKEEIDQIVMQYSIELPGNNYAYTAMIYTLIPEILRQTALKNSIMDYDDMLYLPIVLNIPLPKFDNILLDEVQDINKVQLELLKRLVNNGRLIAVGDKFQSIYGFRGADSSAINTIISEFNADTLPLSISYRLPKNQVNLINTILPDITIYASELAIDGTITTINTAQLASTVLPGDMVICRVNKGLVKPCYDVIRQGKKAIILGKEIGDNLLLILGKLNVKNINDLENQLSDWRDKQLARISEKNVYKIEKINDDMETIIALSENCNSISELEQKISSIFSDDTIGVIFSSVHKVKGLESDNVFLLNPELIPHKRAITEQDIEQEKNIQFVAYSRNKKSFTLVTDN